MQRIKEANSVVVEWLDDGAIIIFKANEQTNEAIDVWAQAIMDIAVERPQDIAFIHDFSSISPTLTPYVRTRIQQVNAEPNKGYVAVILSESALSRVIQFFVNRELVHLQPDVEHRVFFDRDEAVAWMRSRLEKLVDDE